jgi:hypothetical protein
LKEERRGDFERRRGDVGRGVATSMISKGVRRQVIIP